MAVKKFPKVVYAMWRMDERPPFLEVSADLESFEEDGVIIIGVYTLQERNELRRTRQTRKAGSSKSPWVDVQK